MRTLGCIDRHGVTVHLLNDAGQGAKMGLVLQLLAQWICLRRKINLHALSLAEGHTTSKNPSEGASQRQKDR